jgi:hypothetical protein
MYQFLATFLASVGVGILGWAVMIEPRIRVMQTEHKDLKELIEWRLNSIDNRLERIERNLNGSLRRE